MTGAVESVGELLGRQAGRYGEKVFLIVPEDGREISYVECDREVNRVARALAALGVARGDKVAILCTNLPEFLYAFFGAMKVGAVAAPVNHLLKAAEMEFVIGHSEAVVLLTTQQFLVTAESVAKQLPKVRHLIVMEGETSNPGALSLGQLAGQKEASASDPGVNRDDEAVILYTSGTTGKPKGVLLTHGNLLTNARDIAEWHRLQESDRTICLLPLFHANAEVLSTITTLWSGGSVVLPERFSASKFWPIVSKYRPNWFSAAPTILTILLNTPRDQSLDVSSLCFCVCGTAPLPPELHRRFELETGILVLEGYGLTECTCRATFNPHPVTKVVLGHSGAGRKIGSVGLAIGAEVKVFDDEDVEVPTGTVGEVAVRGPSVMKGYFKDAAATAEVMRSGWLHSGDLGRKDEEGYLYITDRKKDMIIRGGENIYPTEVDEVLYRHSKVHQAATLGIPDAKYGEEVTAFVVPREGEVITEEEMVEFCRGHLADFKCPKTVHVIADIPKGPTGKLLRRRLREMYLAGELS